MASLDLGSEFADRADALIDCRVLAMNFPYISSRRAPGA